MSKWVVKMVEEVEEVEEAPVMVTVQGRKKES